MPRLRSNLSKVPVYSPGKPIDEVMRELGLDDVVKVASNECPVPPWPGAPQVVGPVRQSCRWTPVRSSALLRPHPAATGSSF